jgi:hypothetical protein
MGFSDVRVRQLFIVTLLAGILLAGFSGTGEAVTPQPAASQQPESLRRLGASVVSLKFFSTETSKGAAMPMRTYTKDFIRADTHYIWWELQLDAKAKRDKPVRLFLKAIWQRPDGTEFKQSQDVTITPDLEHPCLAAGWGYTKSGGWQPGTYRVVIQIDEIKVASGTFEVFEKLLKKQ